jgi:hypothetical protein
VASIFDFFDPMTAVNYVKPVLKYAMKEKQTVLIHKVKKINTLGPEFEKM